MNKFSTKPIRSVDFCFEGIDAEIDSVDYQIQQIPIFAETILNLERFAPDVPDEVVERILKSA